MYQILMKHSYVVKRQSASWRVRWLPRCVSVACSPHLRWEPSGLLFTASPTTLGSSSLHPEVLLPHEHSKGPGGTMSTGGRDKRLSGQEALLARTSTHPTPRAKPSSCEGQDENSKAFPQTLRQKKSCRNGPSLPFPYFPPQIQFQRICYKT